MKTGMELEYKSYHMNFLKDGRVMIRQEHWGTFTYSLEKLYKEILKVNHMSNMGKISIEDAANRRYVLVRAIEMLEGYG